MLYNFYCVDVLKGHQYKYLYPTFNKYFSKSLECLFLNYSSYLTHNSCINFLHFNKHIFLRMYIAWLYLDKRIGSVAFIWLCSIGLLKNMDRAQSGCSKIRTALNLVPPILGALFVSNGGKQTKKKFQTGQMKIMDWPNHWMTFYLTMNLKLKNLNLFSR